MTSDPATSDDFSRLQDKVEEQAGFIQALFKQSSIGMNLCRLDGLWLQSNPAFLHIIGYSREEADGGLTYWQLTPRKYDAAEAEQLRLLGESGRYGPYEKEFIKKDGSLVPVRLSGYIVERDGIKLIWSFIEDITAERSLETERLKALQASKLSALGELAAGIAHEINNPLAIIGGYAFALEEAFKTGDTALVNEGLAAIKEAVERAGTITHGLRRLARDSSLSAVEDVAVETLLQQAANLTRARTRAEGVALEVDLRTHAHVRGNPIQLGQVLINLVNNAVDAVRTSSVRRVAVRAFDQPGWVVIRVDDTGPGVADEHRARLFDPFFTTKSPDVGTGIGLSISKQIVTASGGSVEYERDNGVTGFVVRLPVCAAAA